MPGKCIVNNCCYDKRDSLHRIPRDETQREIWLDLLDLPLTAHGRICSKHFKQSDFDIKGDGHRWLKRNACPLQVESEPEVTITTALGVALNEVTTYCNSICNEHNYTKLSKRTTKSTQRYPFVISTSKGIQPLSNVEEGVSSKTFIKLGNKYSDVTPEVCAIIWKKISENAPIDFQPMHLLWALVFLKQYTKERDRQVVLKSDEKTIRKWVWVAVELLSNLNVIAWENRKHNAVAGQTEFCSLNAIDFKIQEPKPPSPKWYSPKLRAAGLRYEIGLCIQTGDIVWKNNGYPSGDLIEITLARESYVLGGEPGEKTFAKKAYRNEQFFILPNDENKTEHDRIMAAHDKLHQRLRRFQVLRQPFRNDLEKHPTVFNAVINIVQLSLENGEPLARDVDSFTQLDEPKDGHALSIEEVWVKTEPGDDIEPTDYSHMNAEASIFNIKTEPVDEVNGECIKSEITLGDYECTAATYMTFLQR